MSRDLVGYGTRPPEIVWPNGARLAVNIAVNLEEGAEHQVGDGDPRSERVGEFASVVPEGVRDRGQEQFFAYGTRVGVWRFLDALGDARLPATFWMCGRAVARSPRIAAAIADAGHEAACHGWLWQPHAAYGDRAAEAADLDRTVAAIADATGRRPVGFFCRGSESDHTRSLLAERGFLYTSNAFDDDLPYWDDSGLIVLPYALDTNDARFAHPNGFVRSVELVEYVDDALAVLLDEAERGRSAVLSLGFHLRICGRPARFVAFRAILARLTALGERVWVAPRHAIVSAFAERVPRGVGTALASAGERPTRRPA
ncbi:polysaccharide deacetylase family protein [Acuticoccus sp.]|uniref:polysaccharide deacetylase family protein n=1 Tax=Acuticoccus sp. TaxID=1904378 RepID=UPI003B52EAE7